jgi:hypothetical protein
MGSEETGLGSYEEFGLVSKYGDEPDKLIPGGFKLVSREPLFSMMDEWFFRHLTPIENRRFLLSVYTKGNP